MNASASPRQTQNQKLMELLGMDRMSLSSKTRAAQSTSERWMRYLGFPGGILLFLLILYLPAGAGLSASARGRVRPRSVTGSSHRRGPARDPVPSVNAAAVRP